MDNSIDKFYSYLVDLEENYSKLAGLLKEKIQVADNFDINKLEAIMKEEQICVLVTKSFDKNIEHFRQSIGFEGKTLSDIIEELPEERRPEFHSVFVRLRAALEESRGLNETCQTMIRDKLYFIDKKVKELDKSGSSVYNSAQKSAGTPMSGVFSKSI